jgi:Tol biopolymer transport system component
VGAGAVQRDCVLRENGPGYDIKIHELATGQTRQITFSEGSNESPSYSPSGRHLAFHVVAWFRSLAGVHDRPRRQRPAQVTRSGNNQTPDWSN